MDAYFAPSLLHRDDPAPYEILNEGSNSPFLIVCDHAGRGFPRACGALGLASDNLARHIAWDIGARDIAARMAERLHATAVCGAYSRLVIDLNRYPCDPNAIPEISDGTKIPGNRTLSNPERQRRIDEIHRPYHAEISRQLDRLLESGRRPVLLSVHTMTDRPSSGAARREHYAVLWNERDPDLSRRMLIWLNASGAGPAGDNTPYSLDIGVDYTVPEHGIRRKIPTFMFEVRQDLVGTREAAARNADTVCDGLLAVLASEDAEGLQQ